MSEDRPPVDQAAMQRALEYRLTRRSLLKGAGTGIAGLSLASLLAACGSDE